MFRSPLLFSSSPIWIVVLLAPPAFLQGATWQDDAWTFFEAHCVECHDDASAKGGLDLFTLDEAISGIKAVDLWTRIHDRVAAGEMPPKKKPRPADAEIGAFLASVAPALTRADAELREVALRRLNRLEYEHTVQDLLGIDVELKHLLPEDQKAGGFDTNGEALAVSAELLERYLAAARLALDHAIVQGEAPMPTTFVASAMREVKPYFGKQYGYHEGRIVAYLTDRGNYSKISTRDARLPQRGRYRFKLTAAAHHSDQPIVFSVVASDFARTSAKSVNLGYFEAPPEGKEFVIEAVLDEKFAIQFFAQGLPVYAKDPDLNHLPGVGYSDVEITGPLIDTWPPPSHRQLLGDVDLQSGMLADAEPILNRLASRAFRRPVADAELAPYVQLVADRLAAGRSFEVSLRVGLEAILCSTHFLFLRENPPGEALSDVQLASRLSYFLWSSLPDQALLDAATAGKLRDRKTLLAEIDRMLADPRSDRFVTHFTGQWLKLREIDETVPDSRLYSSFDEVLQVSMVWEGEQFFRKLLDDDLSIENFLDSDFGMLNERLARHYGIEGVAGIDLRPVSFPEDSVRGGVMTQAGVLKVTANGTTTSPVLRGVWVLENILGKHLPPPPPNIAGIEPDIREATTIREQLDLHRNVESCQGCHQHIDPPGFALESFDPIGGFREHYLQFKVNPEHADKGWGRVVDAKPVDASGVMPNGEAFDSIRAFKRLLLANSEPFAHCLTERLLTYGTGREFGFSDRAAIAAIAQRANERGNGLRTLIHEIALSDLFQHP